MSKFARDMLLCTAGSILICSAIGAMMGYPGVGFAIGCGLVIGLYAAFKFIAWLFVEMIISIFNGITGTKSRR
jgi:hypothetical protein